MRNIGVAKDVGIRREQQSCAQQQQTTTFTFKVAKTDTKTDEFDRGYAHQVYLRLCLQTWSFSLSFSQSVQAVSRRQQQQQQQAD